MTNLYSYCIPCDDGAAPNPFWGVCTLVICKPGIRRTAQVGDWIVGTGAKRARLGGDGTTKDMSGKLVYAMMVTNKMSMAEYDAHTRTELPGKIPDWSSPELQRRLGDAIYDYSHSKNPLLRKSVHGEANRITDLSGENALLSTHFFYFGDEAIPLPDGLRPIAQNQQGHRKQLNGPCIGEFVNWVNGFRVAPGTVIGKPLFNPFAQESSETSSAECRRIDHVDDCYLVVCGAC